ncbi:MAG: outer membrane beta-barrel protein [Gemmatimonadota bacterium]
MKSQLRIAALSMAVAALAANSADAQRRRGLVDVSERSDRHGFWFQAGVGAGKDQFKFADENSYADNPTKPTFTIRMGGTVSPNFRLGGELTSYVNSFTNGAGYRTTEYVGGLFLIGQYYPIRDAGFFIKGGGGLTRSGADVSGGQGTSEDGFGFTAGAGYEIRLGRAIYLTPTVDWFNHRSGQQGQPDLLEHVFSVGIGFTIQPGR